MLPDPNGRRKRGDGGDLTVPDVAGLSLEEAALTYADAGWYVLPTDPADIKNPGSVAGGKWQELSSRDLEQIRRWWSRNPDYGIALHCGRSGAVVFDLDSDDFDSVPGRFADALRSADAIQLTRAAGDRGHYVFAMPPGESLSNRAGAFATYGEVRGKNGVVIAAPTPHPDGGNYHWAKTGAVVTPPPDALRQCLSAANTNNVEPLSDKAFEDFLLAHDRNDRPGAMSVVLEKFRADVEAGVSRHYAVVKYLGMGYRDAIAGYYPARRLTEALSEAFHAAYETPIPGRRSAPKPDEFICAARYVAAEERGADPEQLRARKNGFTDVENQRLADRALAPGGRWHPDTLWPKLDPDVDEEFDREVQRRRRLLRINRAAESAEAAEGWTLPPLSDEIGVELAKGVPPIEYVVENLAPKGSNVLLVAERKVGKTTLVMNLVVAATRGERFLDRYMITLPEGTSITYLNFELDREQANRWLDDMGAGRSGAKLRLYVDNWKGYRIPLPADHVEDAMVEQLLGRHSSVLVIDPYGAMIGHEENSNTEVREWTNAIDRIARRAGLELVVIAAHSGSSSIGAEDVRVRGAYRLEDWMSVKWSYTHAGEVNEQDPTDSSRYLSALGRDVNVPAFELAYDPIHRRLVAASGGRSKTEAVTDKYALLAYDTIAAYTNTQKEKGAEEPIELNAGDLARKAKVAPTGKHAKLFTTGRDCAVEKGWLIERKQAGAKLYSLGNRPPQRKPMRLVLNPERAPDDQ